MNFEPENYSRSVLLLFVDVIEIVGWVAVIVVLLFADVNEITGWVAVIVVTWGICMVIEWVTA
ncbi:hypothetical protein [Klebsiella pneumoniae]|uniref:hypothetical protein n=1 Tax=Klebsiella pneumoniae TaxID=573 RepID=UPI000E2C412F|nr:hypothetical protein [Klebsiella pneumoniae]SWL28954.1 Uncharacterised protein [Klebsiella pneumoniae]